MEVFALDSEGLNIPRQETLEGKLKSVVIKERKPGKNKMILVFAVLIVLCAIALFTYYQFFYKNQFTGKEKSIAVLPFETSGLDSNNVYL
jgi:Tfp pilus assembly protein PilN